MGNGFYFFLSIQVIIFYDQGGNNLLLTRLSTFVFVYDHIRHGGVAESGQPWG